MYQLSAGPAERHDKYFLTYKNLRNFFQNFEKNSGKNIYFSSLNSSSGHFPNYSYQKQRFLKDIWRMLIMLVKVFHSEHILIGYINLCLILL
jgi:hypothetical protein